MASIRPCVAEDLFAMQDCNTANLPENYQMKNDECEPRCHGHITSIAVSRPERKQGIAQQLLRVTHRAMQKCFSAEYSSLHVRVSNRAAYSLYSHLGYKKHELEKMYYSDKEDALSLHCLFPYGEQQNAQRQEKKQARTHKVPEPTTIHTETTAKKLDTIQSTTSTLRPKSLPDVVSSPTEPKQDATHHHGKFKKNKKKK